MNKLTIIRNIAFAAMAALVVLVYYMTRECEYFDDQGKVVCKGRIIFT